MEPEKKKKNKESRQRRDKGHAVKTSDGPREGKNQEGRQAGKKGTKQQGTHKTFDKEIVGVGPLPPAPCPVSTREKAGDPSEPHDRIRIRYQESVTKFGSAFAGLH